MFYLIQNGKVAHKGVKKLRAYIGDYIESGEDWELGSIYVDGVFSVADTSLTDEEIEALRSQAYADPLTGSDRLLNDYQASLALGSDDAEDKKEAWLARREEIKAEYPFND